MNCQSYATEKKKQRSLGSILRDSVQSEVKTVLVKCKLVMEHTLMGKKIIHLMRNNSSLSSHQQKICDECTKYTTGKV